MKTPNMPAGAVRLYEAIFSGDGRTRRVLLQAKNDPQAIRVANDSQFQSQCIAPMYSAKVREVHAIGVRFIAAFPSLNAALQSQAGPYRFFCVENGVTLRIDVDLHGNGALTFESRFSLPTPALRNPQRAQR